MKGFFTSKAQFFSFFLLTFLYFQSVFAQQPAFPGAEGAGMYTSGGRGTASVPTTVFEVTNLGDVNSPGSLRYAVSASATYRTIVFRVSGTIHLTSRLTIRSNTTIAGQTAPGDGICIADYPVVISGDNVILRYIRCRMGDRYALRQKVDGAGGDDALGNLGNKKLIIDHCSISWSTDEALTVYRGDSVTLQWNLISEPLNYSYHFETGDADFEQHGYGGIWGARHGSFHHNLIAHCRNRTPRFGGISTYSPSVQGAEMCDFRNNVLYNWGINNVYGGEGGYYNMVNNYYKWGPITSSSRKFQVVAVDYGTNMPYAKYYLKGNYVDGSAANTANNWKSVTMKSGNLSDTSLSKVTTPFSLPAITTESATDAYANVLANVGASFPKRDTLDERIINDVKNRTGKLIDVQGGFAHGTPYDATINAWPTLNSTTAPADSDQDGMPDSFEEQYGLNKGNAADRNTYDVSGYTMLEMYLNSLVSNVTVTPDPTPEPTPTPTTGNDGSSSAVWPLESDGSVVVSGDITATAQTMHTNMSVKGYTNFGAGAVNTSDFVPYTAQRVIPNGGNTSTFVGWPENQTAPVDNQWVQYQVAPVSGKDLFVTKIAFDFGPAGSTNTMKAKVYYSLDGFATAGTVLSTTPLTLPAHTKDDNSYETISYSGLNIKVPSGSTLSVRVYPWWPSTASPSKYLVEKNVVISGNTVLPLDLIDFRASIISGLQRSVRLDWTTAREVNTKVFEIEKNVSGKFERTGSVAARNEEGTFKYSFTDLISNNGVMYYRLKMIDQNGLFKYSNVVAVRIEAKGSLTLFPNPAGNSLSVIFPAGDNTSKITLLGLDGRVYSSNIVPPGSTLINLSVANLPKGTYLIVISDNTKAVTSQFIKN